MFDWKKPENYELKEQASLLQEEEVVEQTIGEKTYCVSQLILKDYRSNKITEWNQKHHSILTTEITVLCDGKKVIQEQKYDTGYPPDGMTVKTIANRINGSTGQTITKKTERDSVFNMPVFEIQTPPTVMNIITTHLLSVVMKFEELEKKAVNLSDIIVKDVLR